MVRHQVLLERHHLTIILAHQVFTNLLLVRRVRRLEQTLQRQQQHFYLVVLVVHQQLLGLVEQ
jgi:hypothetical protein